jgi:hypothetical protein
MIVLCPVSKVISCRAVITVSTMRAQFFPARSLNANSRYSAAMITAMVDLRFGEVAAALSVRLAGGVDERVAIGEDQEPADEPDDGRSEERPERAFDGAGARRCGERAFPAQVDPDGSRATVQNCRTPVE